MPQTSSRTVTLKEAANLLDVSIDTVKRCLAAGLLNPAQKLPGKTGAYLFDPAEVARFKAERDAARNEAVAR